ncbi:MAG: amidohydrolase family protein, partial [Nitrososphaerales archaeon]
LKYNLKELLRLMEANDVYSGLLLSPPLSNGLPAPNKRIVDLCMKSKDRLLPVLTAEPNKTSVSECVELAKKMKDYVKGFKIRLGYVKVLPDDMIFSRLYDYAESSDLPVLFHTGDTATSNGSLMHSHPLGLDSLANKRENLKIVACHFGNPWILDTAELLYKHKNVFADISGLFARGAKYSSKYLDYLGLRLSKAIYYIGNADKIIFGTDYPVETLPDAISLVRKIRVDGPDREKIFSLNARKVFPI